MRKYMLLGLLTSIAFLNACGNQPTQSSEALKSKSFFAMDTYMTITVYGENSESALNQAEKRFQNWKNYGLLQTKTAKFMP